MENCMCRAPYGGWSSESILLQGKIMSPECICLYSVQVRKEGSYFPCLAGMQIVESKTPFTPPQGGWKRPLFLRQEVAVWLPPYLYPADHKMHCLCLEHPNKSSKVTLKIRLSIQTTIRTYSQLKGHHKPNTLVCFVLGYWIRHQASSDSAIWDECKEKRQTATLIIFYQRLKRAYLPHAGYQGKASQTPQLFMWHLLSCSDATKDHKVKTEQPIWQISVGETKQKVKKRRNAKLF